MSDQFAPQTIVVVGASGGIGGAFMNALSTRYPQASLHALSRSGSQGVTGGTFRTGVLDYNRPETIEAAALEVQSPADLVIVATGLLHGDGFGPEKSLRDLSADNLARSYLVNSIGPALVAKHFLPLMPRTGKSVFAVISARVGSISDNRLGGWYGYRAAKAGLNQVLKTASIEHARRHRESVVIGLHPGTVDTGLSKPFQANVAEGKLFTPDFAARKMLDVIERVTAADTGKVFAWDGEEVPA